MPRRSALDIYLRRTQKLAWDAVWTKASIPLMRRERVLLRVLERIFEPHIGRDRLRRYIRSLLTSSDPTVICMLASAARLWNRHDGWHTPVRALSCLPLLAVASGKLLRVRSASRVLPPETIASLGWCRFIESAQEGDFDVLVCDNRGKRGVTCLVIQGGHSFFVSLKRGREGGTKRTAVTLQEPGPSAPEDGRRVFDESAL